jgi:hypothetical protein
MNRQQLRVVREPEQTEQGRGAEGEDKDKKADVPKRKQRISSVSPERKAGAHFTCFTSTRVQILTYPPSATQARLITCFTGTKVQMLAQKALLSGPPAPPAQQQANEEEYEKKKRKRDRELEGRWQRSGSGASVMSGGAGRG